MDLLEKETHLNQEDKKKNWQQQKKQKNNILGESKHQKFLAIVVIIQVLLLTSLVFKISGITGAAVIEDDQKVQVKIPAGTIPTENKLANFAALLDDDDVKGDENAPVTIIEFSDYECPYCAKFYADTYKQIEEKYIKTGQVKFVFRDFPLSFHQNAQKAAEAAECAGEQGKYYEMHNKLFEEGVQGGVVGFKKYAREMGLNSASFDLCLDLNKAAAEVKKDMQDGQVHGVRGTPAFFINGQQLSGAQPFSVFEQIIEQELDS